MAKKEIITSDMYKPNSYKSKRERAANVAPPKVDKVTTGKVVVRDKTPGKRLVDGVTNDLRRYISNAIRDSVIPAAKDTASEVFHSITDSLIYGDEAPKKGRRRNYSTKIVSGNGRPARRSQDRSYRSVSSKSVNDFRDVILETKDEAYNVLKGLEELINEYDQASIADFYNLCGITGKFTDHKWGWTDLTGSRVVRAYGGGYEVELPRPEALD